MSLTQEQQDAYVAASTSGGTSVTHEFFSSFLIALVLLWAAWLLLNAYRAWTEGKLGLGAAGGIYLRSILLIIMLIWFFKP